MTIRDAPKCDEHELNERLRIAREFKAKSCGQLLKSEVFGEPEPKHMIYTPRKRSESETQTSREYQKQWQLRHRIAVAKRKQQEHGGTYGITADYFAQRGVAKFRSHAGKTQVYDCAIDAAEYRNAVMRHKYPQVPEFQVDLDAVWRKWGCTCGKHKRAK